MKSILLAVALLSCSTAFAQSDEPEAPGPTTPEFSDGAGGPTEIQPGTQASDLSVDFQDVDLTLKTGIGSFSISKHYRSAPGWKVSPPNNELHGASTLYLGAWFSSLNSYAVLRHEPFYVTGSPGNLVQHEEVTNLQARDTEGNLTTSEEFGALEPLANELTLPTKGHDSFTFGGGPNRLIRSATTTTVNWTARSSHHAPFNTTPRWGGKKILNKTRENQTAFRQEPKASTRTKTLASTTKASNINWALEPKAMSG